MIEISLGSILVIAGLLMTFFLYVAAVSYRLGRREQRVDTNEKRPEEVEEVHASKSDLINLKDQISRLETAINKIFDLMREDTKNRIDL